MAHTPATGQLADPHFWVLISTILLAVLLYAKAKKPILELLDKRTAHIKADLAEAARLKAEAEALLADMQKRHTDAVTTAQKIIDSAKQTAIQLQADSSQKLQDTLERRESQLLERISRAEAAAIQQLREQAADIAATSAEILLQDAMKSRGAKLVDEAIAEITARAS